MRLWVIRHGESENNRDRVWTGQSDTPLTEKGRLDAEGVRPLLEGVSFDAIFSSDLSRAVETARIALQSEDFTLSPLLREMNVGDLTGLPISVLSPEERAEATRQGYGAYNGETRSELDGRIASFTDMLINKGYKSVAAFSHAGFIRAFTDSVIGFPLPRGKMICANCAVVIFDHNGEQWRLHSWINQG